MRKRNGSASAHASPAADVGEAPKPIREGACAPPNRRKRESLWNRTQ